MSKRLLILGGNPETVPLVTTANDIGVHTIVVDPNKKSPAKHYARESYEVDCLNVNELERLALKIGVDGILVGVADILVPSYFELCKRFKLPTYANPMAVEAFTSKTGFIEACKKAGVTTTPSFSEQTALENNIPNQCYPILVKPVDNGGGVGISICHNFAELSPAIDKARSASKTQGILLEKFMTCDDMAAYYSFVDGQAFLVATSDRFTSKKTYRGSPVCIGASYPSKHEDRFDNEVHPKLLEMFKHLKLKDGVLNIQFFADSKGFYAYDPGFRLQGEGFHIHVEEAFGIDQKEALIRFSLDEPLGSYSTTIGERRVGDKFYAATAWVLLKPGTIHEIVGLEKIDGLKSFKSKVVRLGKGDQITEEIMGTEKQVFCRIYLQHQNLGQLHNDIDVINDKLEVNSIDDSLIFDALSSKILRSNMIS